LLFALIDICQAAGVSPPCFTSISLQKMDDGSRDDAYREDIIQGVAGTMYAAGSDTVRMRYLLWPSVVFM
jgi:hypothetical protein